jgi:hypothetical protein
VDAVVDAQRATDWKKWLRTPALALAIICCLVTTLTSCGALLYLAWRGYESVEVARHAYSRGAINAEPFNIMLRDHGAPSLIQGPPGDPNLGAASVEDGEAIAWLFRHDADKIMFILMTFVFISLVQLGALVVWAVCCRRPTEQSLPPPR